MIVSLISRFVKYKFPDVSNISTEEVSHLDQDKTILVDTRKKEEYDVSFIPRAVHLEFPASEDDVAKFVSEHVRDDTENVVCYCSLGYRSSIVAGLVTKHLKEHNMTNINVYNLEGSIFKWVNEDRPVLNTRLETVHYSHPFNIMWGLLGLSLSKWKWSQ